MALVGWEERDAASKDRYVRLTILGAVMNKVLRLDLSLPAAILSEVAEGNAESGAYLLKIITRTTATVLSRTEDETPPAQDSR